MVAPVPCAQCGNLFMRQDLTLDKPRLCNNCEYGAMKKQTVKLAPIYDTNQITLAIVCERQIAIEIEEICTNEGISMGEYFKRLHLKNTSSQCDKEKVFITHPEGRDCSLLDAPTFGHTGIEKNEKFAEAVLNLEVEINQQSQKNKPKRGKK